MRKTFALAAVALAVGLTGAQAQEKVWKHGILEAKSDAGFIAMVDKGGFAAKRGLKVELLQIKAGATLMKALLSGEIDSVDMGAAESIVAHFVGGDRRSREVLGSKIRRHGRPRSVRFTPPISRETRAQVLNRNNATSPSANTYSLPSSRYLPASRAAAVLPSRDRSE